MRPVVLVILDGWGIGSPGPGNAISQAHLPTYNHLWFSFPHTTLMASGEAVGLPRGEPGNTETGHLNIGAGRIVYQDLPRINMAIADGTFYQKEALLSAINHARKKGGKLHIAGLVGSGGIHSNIEHLYALLNLCKEQQYLQVFIHVFTDGRDSPPTSAFTYIEQLQREMRDLGVGEIATVMGRYYAMDRDNRWDRTKKAYSAMVNGEGEKAKSLEEAIRSAYAVNLTDEFVVPTVIVNDSGHPKAQISTNDAVIFFNFRVDRLRQLTKAFVYDDLAKAKADFTQFDPFAIKYFKKHSSEAQTIREPFKRGPKITNLFVATMTEYEKGLPVDGIVFPTEILTGTLGEVIAKHSFKQLRATETEKERFVTYYFSGQREIKFPGENWLIVPSPKVATYDLVPQMSAVELTEELIKEISRYQFIVVNYPNADMVGHTGHIGPAIHACETIDQSLGKLIPAILKADGYCIITGDHGNVEEMLDGGSKMNTEHSANPVPFIAIAKEWENQNIELSPGILADLAPTILEFLRIPKPKEMTGRYLLR